MRVEIWSDVMCPFCYIGKRHFEKAIEKLPYKDEIEVEWKSFLLNPDYHNTSSESLYDYLARVKGMTVEQAKQLTGNVLAMASQAGLALDFDKSVPANSFEAHRLIHFAKSKGLQNEAEEALFFAHFIQGKDIAKQEQLIEIGESLGFATEELTQMLTTKAFDEAVNYDVYESKQFGISGVPYFIFDRKYALSGAQPVDTFERAIKQSFEEWKATQPQIGLTSLNRDNDAVCDENGCEI